jgi:SpoVT / AbrB like domain.
MLVTGKVKKIGNSLWVLIPSAIAKQHDLSEGSEVGLSSNGKSSITIRKKMTPIDAVTVAANVSYRDGPTRQEVESIFLTGILPPKFEPHIHRILTEMPAKLIEDAARQLCENPFVILNNLKKIGDDLDR